MPELQSYTTQTARKQHNCSWCGKKIEKGERYERFSAKDDGEFFVIKWHKSPCADQVDHARSLVPYPEDLSLDELYDKYFEDQEKDDEQRGNEMSPFAVCGQSIYEFAGLTFEMHSYCGPWPLRKNGELRARAGRRFWKVWEQFDALTDDEKQKHRTHTGGCLVVGK